MLPVLQIGPAALPVYPLSILLAVWAALAAGAWAARRASIDGDHAYNAGMFGLIAAVGLARLAHVIAFWPAYRLQPVEIVGLNTRAFLWWPGLAAALLVAGWYCHRHRLPWAAMADAGALGALVGIGIAHLGAFLAGQDLGAPTHLPWGISTWGLPRHPFQLYSALASLATAGVVAWLVTRQGRRGTAALGALAGYGTALWLLEPARANSLTVLGGLRVAQLLGLGAMILALLLLRARLNAPQDEMSQA
jgi:phosphatidylglycerol---prolipoprotein diacylglyceryl transferase